MAEKSITVAPGIRARKHATRKHGVRLDRYFTLRFSVDGHQVEEALGWASEGWTVERAQDALAELRRAKRTGEGPVTLREKANARRAAERQDAAAQAERERREKTVDDLWDRYSKEIVAVHNRASTAAEKTRLWIRRIKPAIGTLKLNAVTEEDAGAVVRAPLRLNDAGAVIGGKAEAGNIYRLLHHMFAKALAWRLRPREFGNPLDNIDEPKVARRERLLSSGEIGALLRVLDEAVGEPPQITAVIKAAIYTGARISELLKLRIEHVRRDEMELHLPDTKTGFSRRPMSSETLAAIDSLDPMPGVPFVFRAIRDARKPLPYHTIEKAFRRIATKAGVRNCTLHTLRHWLATMTANSVSNPRIGMAITGHKSHQAYMNYVHGDKDQARALAEQLAQLADGLAKSSRNIHEMTPKHARSGG
jgi:integrase